MVDLNMVILSGRLATPPELRVFESGSRLVRYLVTVRSDEPRRRVDVLPVTVWNPDEEAMDPEPTPGRRIWLAGSVQRRFWDGEQGRRSRLEIVAEHVTLASPAPVEVGS
jgi:single-stranded DNA-binding protein